MGQQALRYFFLISILLVAVAYFVGSSTIIAAGAHALQTISYAATGRTSDGRAFAGYPGGALPQGVLG